MHRCLGRADFNYKETVGKQNAENIARTLNVQAIIPSQQQALDATEVITEDFRKINSIREKLWNDYINHVGEFKNTIEFVKTGYKTEGLID